MHSERECHYDLVSERNNPKKISMAPAAQVNTFLDDTHKSNKSRSVPRSLVVSKICSGFLFVAPLEPQLFNLTGGARVNPAVAYASS